MFVCSRFFLFNEPSEKNKDKALLTHHFAVDRGPNRIVKLPDKKWSGSLNDLNETVTIVSLEALGNLVEDIHKKLLELISENKLALQISETRFSLNNVGYQYKT